MVCHLGLGHRASRTPREHSTTVSHWFKMSSDPDTCPQQGLQPHWASPTGRRLPSAGSPAPHCSPPSSTGQRGSGCLQTLSGGLPVSSLPSLSPEPGNLHPPHPMTCPGTPSQVRPPPPWISAWSPDAPEPHRACKVCGVHMTMGVGRFGSRNPPAWGLWQAWGSPGHGEGRWGSGLLLLLPGRHTGALSSVEVKNRK